MRRRGAQLAGSVSIAILRRQMFGAFQAFTRAFVVSGGTGAPSDETLFSMLCLYPRGFGSFQTGYASALAWLLLLDRRGADRVELRAGRAVGLLR